MIYVNADTYLDDESTNHAVGRYINDGERVESRRGSTNKQTNGRAEDVCKSIDIMVGHTARTSNQERYWSDML